jgi:hypothetical protein
LPGKKITKSQGHKQKLAGSGGDFEQGIWKDKFAAKTPRVASHLSGKTISAFILHLSSFILASWRG